MSHAVADELLQVLASIRRSGRRQPGRPSELAQLSGAQLELVRVIRRRPGISVADAAHELRIAPNTVSTLVRQLTDAGLLARTADPGDRRVAHLELAPEIRGKVDAWLARRTAALSAAMAELPPADARRIADALPALARLAERLEATGPGA